MNVKQLLTEAQEYYRSLGVDGRRRRRKLMTDLPDPSLDVEEGTAAKLYRPAMSYLPTREEII